jgi:hypothetical protein
MGDRHASVNGTVDLWVKVIECLVTYNSSSLALQPVVDLGLLYDFSPTIPHLVPL